MKKKSKKKTTKKSTKKKTKKVIRRPRIQPQRRNSSDNLEQEIRAIDDMAQQLSVWNLKYDPFPDTHEWIEKHWHQPYGADVIKKYFGEIMKKRSDNYWGVNQSGPVKRWDDFDIAKLSWRGIKADLRGDFGPKTTTSKPTKVTLLARDQDLDGIDWNKWDKE